MVFTGQILETSSSSQDNTAYTLTAAIRDGLRGGSRAVIKPVDFFFYFGREPDSMQFVTAPQTAHGFTDLTDFAEPRMRIAVLDIDTRAGLDAFGRVVAIVRNVAGAIFDEIILGHEPALDDDGASRVQK